MEGKEDEVLKSLKKNARSLMEDLKKIDFEGEATNFMSETEKVLNDLSDQIEKKRTEMEEAGVEETIRKDINEVEKGVDKMVKDIEKILQ